MIKRLLSTMATGTSPPLHDMVKPLAWLVGKWRAEKGDGHYPTIKSFNYVEELEFFHVGQPNIQFAFNSFKPGTNEPLHREVGFLRMKPESNIVAFLCAQNLGVAEVEEGEVKGQELHLESHSVGRLSFGKSPVTKKISRVFIRTEDELQQIVHMETDKTPMTEHLRTKYVKVQ